MNRCLAQEYREIQMDEYENYNACLMNLQFGCPYEASHYDRKGQCDGATLRSEFGIALADLTNDARRSNFGLEVNEAEAPLNQTG